MANIKKMWQCSTCGDNHEYEDNAEDCCRPDSSKLVYVCPECGDDYRSIELAQECFDDHEKNKPDYVPPPPTAAELEAAGQQRIIP